MDQRPLWRRIADFPLVAMLIAVALYMLALGFGEIAGGIVGPSIADPGLAAAIKGAISIVLVLLAYKLVIVHLGEHPRDELPASPSLRPAAVGLGLGFALMAVAVAVAAILQVYRITGPGDTSRLVVELVGTAILPGFMEELLFRGILFRWIEELAGSWVGLVVSSALFGLAHILNPNATWFSSFAIAVETGVLLGGAYMLTRNLWMPMGLHAAWNFTQGEVFDVPVSGLDEHGLVEAQLSGPPLLSGGGFGLEASLIAFVIATAAGLWLVRRAVRRGQLVQPWWVRRRRERIAA